MSCPLVVPYAFEVGRHPANASALAWGNLFMGWRISTGEHVEREFMFAAAAQVPKLMREFEREPLREYTPCRYDNAREQATALAVVHAELILIHPFREGKGSCSRLLAILMGLQAGLPALDFGGIRGRKKTTSGRSTPP